MKKSLAIMFVLALALSLTSVALAQVPNSPFSMTLTANNLQPGAIDSTETLVGSIMGLVNWFAWFIGLAAVAMGLYAGILFITAGGDSAKVVTARNILLYAIVGIAVEILAFSLVAISQSIFSLQ